MTDFNTALHARLAGKLSADFSRFSLLALEAFHYAAKENIPVQVRTKSQLMRCCGDAYASPYSRISRWCYSSQAEEEWTESNALFNPLSFLIRLGPHNGPHSGAVQFEFSFDDVTYSTPIILHRDRIEIGEYIFDFSSPVF